MMHWCYVPPDFFFKCGLDARLHLDSYKMWCRMLIQVNPPRIPGPKVEDAFLLSSLEMQADTHSLDWFPQRWDEASTTTKKGTNRVAKVPKKKYLYYLLWISDMKQLFHIPTINSLYVGKKPRFNNLTHLGMLPTGIFEIQGNWPRSQQHLHRGFALRLVNWQKEKVRLSFSHHTWKNVYVIYIYINYTYCTVRMWTCKMNMDTYSRHSCDRRIFSLKPSHCQGNP